MFPRFIPVRFTQFLTGIVIFSCLLLLLGLRLNIAQLGGQNQASPCPAINLNHPETMVYRGQMMLSPADTFTQYQLCDGTKLYLDSNTQIELSRYQNPSASEQTQLKLIQGRVIIDGIADVHARNVVVGTRGSGCELVHYSWLDELDITPFAALGCVMSTESLPASFADLAEEDNLPPLQTTRVSTFDGSISKIDPFQPEHSSAQNFYRWTGLDLENLR